MLLPRALSSRWKAGAVLLFALVGLVFRPASRPPPRIDVLKNPYSPDAWPQGWTPPEWPNVDCKHEMHNTKLTCDILVRCLRRDGIALVLNDTKRRLPFWYSQPLAHMVAQATSSVAADNNEVVRAVNFFSDMYHLGYTSQYIDSIYGNGSPGVMHASLWYAAGTQPRYATWEHIEELVPMPDPSVPTGVLNEPGSKDSLFDWMSMGVGHGLGHAGFIAAHKKKMGGMYDACSHAGPVDAATAIGAYSICESAPSEALRYVCTGGYFHALFEHFDHVADGSGKDWMWPCSEPGALPPVAKKGQCARSCRAFCVCCALV